MQRQEQQACCAEPADEKAEQKEITRKETELPEDAHRLPWEEYKRRGK